MISQKEIVKNLNHFQSPNTGSAVKAKTLGEEEIAIKAQLIPHENKYLKIGIKFQKKKSNNLQVQQQ